MSSENEKMWKEESWHESSWIDQDFKLGSLIMFVLPTGFLMMFSSLYSAVDGYFVSNFVGAADLLWQDSYDYLKLLSWFAIPLLLMRISQMFFIADGKPYFGFTVGIINMILDYVFIGRMDMGVEGVALATGIGYSIPAITYLVYFLRSKQGLCFKKPVWDRKIITSACTNGSSVTFCQGYLRNLFMKF